MAKEIERVYTEIGERLRHLRLDRGLTQEEVGGLLAPPVTRAGIAKIESGKQRLLVHSLLQLAALFETEPADLVRTQTADQARVGAQIEAELRRKLPLPAGAVQTSARRLYASLVGAPRLQRMSWKGSQRGVAFARTCAARLLKWHGTGHAPVELERVAAQLGVRIARSDLGAGVAGLLATHGESAVVWVQQSDPGASQRLTIAHELGHVVLQHAFATGEYLHVVRGNFLSIRRPRSSRGIDRWEIDANAFAVALLMPKALLAAAIADLGGAAPDDRQISNLASLFEVSEPAMTMRLTALRWL